MVDNGEIVEYPEPPPHVKKIDKNGAGWSKITKKICDPPGTYGPDPYRITKDNALDYNKRRWEVSTELAMEGAGLAAGKGKTGYDAWIEINRTQAHMAMDEKRGRASTEAAKFVGHATQLLPDRSRRDDSADSGRGLTVNIPADALLRLVEALRTTTGGGDGDG